MSAVHNGVDETKGNNSGFMDVSGQEASDILAAALQQMDGIIAGRNHTRSLLFVHGLTL